MSDQVTKLNDKGIPATLLGSAQKEDVMTQLHQFRLVFTTPESFFDRINKKPHNTFLKMASKDQLTLLAIDEGHLICDWKSFRYMHAFLIKVF